MNNAPSLLFAYIESALSSTPPSPFKLTIGLSPHSKTIASDPDVHTQAVPVQPCLNLDPAEAADAFVTALFLAGVSRALVEQHWLLTHDLKQEQPAFSAFLKIALDRELTPLDFLAPLWRESDSRILKAMATAANRFSKIMIEMLGSSEPTYYREFVYRAVQAMTRFSHFEEQFILQRLQADENLQRRLASLNPSTQWPTTRPMPEEGLLPTSLYRAFDEMDQVFQLRYERDIGMKTDSTTHERLYEGAGRGVQTSYVTILTALRHLNLPQNGHLVDLGSGYGRVGLISGLWRQDLRFTGYEYVGHRIDVSREAAARAGVSDRVHFFQQDLADTNFALPIADAYYLYDPFCETTYKTVLQHLHIIGRQKGVTVVTKSGANKWFLQAAEQNGWSQPERMDEGTLLLFRSQASK